MNDKSQMTLVKVSTVELINELSKREAIKYSIVNPYQNFEVQIDNEKLTNVPEVGPAVIIICWD